jgi:hypothetical protein
VAELSIVTDIPDWVQPFADFARKSGWAVACYGVDDSIPEEGLLFNRISSGAGGSAKTFEASLALLEKLQRAGCNLVNNANCHRIGSSKWAQFQLFESAGAKTPRTAMLISGQRVEPMANFLLKPNAGGYGKGIVTTENGALAPESLDDIAILQQKITPADARVHRVELVAGEVVYKAATPVADSGYNHCLGNITTTEITGYCTPNITALCRRIAKLAELDVGSLEYLLDENETPWFIDLNPVSTYSPTMAEQGFQAVLDHLRRRTGWR